MTRPDKLGLTLLVGAGLYLWFWHPAVMAGVLLTLLVFGMLVLSVAAMMRRDRRRMTETKSAHALRLVNEQEPRWHHWR